MVKEIALVKQDLFKIAKHARHYPVGDEACAVTSRLTNYL